MSKRRKRSSGGTTVRCLAIGALVSSAVVPVPAAASPVTAAVEPAAAGQTVQYVASVVGGTDRLIQREPATRRERVLHTGGSHDAVAWSPDGTRVAFAWSPTVDGVFDLYVIDAAPGAPVRRLTTTAGIEETDPAWSPDGSTLLYTAYGIGTTQLRTVPATGGSSTALPGGTDAARGSWIPGATAVVAETDQANLVRIDTTSGVRSAITGTSQGFLGHVSPDGTLLSYFVDDGADAVRLQTVPVGGSSSPAIVAQDLAFPASSWIAGSDRLLWVDSDANSDVLMSGRADGTQIRSEGTSSDPIWDLDGRLAPALSGPAAAARGDWDGDGTADLVARDAAGGLWLYPGNGSGGFLSRRQIGVGWNGFTTIVTSTDFDGDSFEDILGRDTSGRLWLYPGNGSGGFLSRRQIGVGWNGFTAILAPGDFDGDGDSDVVGRDSSGRLWLYPGNGSGGFVAPRQIGSGWASFRAIVTPGDTTGDGAVDVVGTDSSGRLWLYPGNGSGGFLSRRQIGSGWATWTGLWGPGDTTGDGNPDLHARDSAGRLWLYPGTVGGGYGTRRLIGSGWNSYTVAR